MVFTQVPVTGTYAPGGVPATGSVALSLVNPMVNGGVILDTVPVVCALDGSGSVAFSVAPTDGQGTYPSGGLYRVVESLTGQPVLTYWIQVSSASTGIDLGTVAHLPGPGRLWSMAQPVNGRGMPGGYPSLDSGGRIPFGQLPDALAGTYVPQVGSADALFTAAATAYGVPGPVVEDVATGSLFRLRVRNGVVEAVLASLPLPSKPVSLSATATVNSVRLSWAAGSGGGAQNGFNIYRNGLFLATVTTLAYSDYAVVVGTAYTYQVSAVNPIGESAKSVSATGTPAVSLNRVPSTPVISLWPVVLPTSGSCLVRISAAEPDTQNMVFRLTVDVGTVAATEDPSVFVYTAP